MSSWKHNVWAKIVFLDIDWVLVAPYIKWQETHQFNEWCVAWLKEIINKTWAKIVISSSWRYKLDKLIEQWWLHDIEMFIDTTQHHYGDNNLTREAEIITYLNHNNIKKYVIIDDCYMLSLKVFKLNWTLVKTDRKLWIQKEDVTRAIEILTN